jgi:predicted outer membrane repeat protein
MDVTCGGAIFSYGALIVTNCAFIENVCLASPSFGGSFGGAICNDSSIFVVTNCTFTQNSAICGGAIFSFSNETFIITNCVFTENSANVDGGAVCVDSEPPESQNSFISINCTFFKNSANDYGQGGAISNRKTSRTYLYHCTFDSNQAKDGRAIINKDPLGEGKLYSYNCIYTGDTNQIQGTITAGINLIECENGITRDAVFGNNEYDTTSGYIMPLPYAKTATRLTTNYIAVPTEIITADSIISLLTTDQSGNTRPTTGYVTYGSVECDNVSILENDIYDISIVPNPTENDFSIIFDNPESQTISIELIDLSGRKIFDIYSGFASTGKQIYNVVVNNYLPLPSGTYFVKFVIKGKTAVKKIMING